MEEEEQPEEYDSTTDSKINIKWTITLADQYWNALQKRDLLFAQPRQNRALGCLTSEQNTTTNQPEPQG